MKYWRRTLKANGLKLHQYRNVSGDLVKVEHKTSEWEGTIFDNVSLTLQDSAKNETYLIDFKLNMLTRSLLNSLFNLTAFQDVKLGLYTGKKDYPAIGVRQAGELVKWKYSLDEIPVAEEVTFKGRVMRDYSLVDSFYVEKIKELAAPVR